MECLANVLDQKYPQFNTVSPQHLLVDALHQMHCENVEYLIVLEDEQFTGIISEHDVTKKLLFLEKPLTDLKVEEVMNRNLPVANTQDSLEYGMQLLDRYNTRYMAIYDGFDFKGVLSENDLLKQAVINLRIDQEEDNPHAFPWHY